MDTQQKIEKFLSSLAVDSPFHHQIICHLRSLANKISPAAEERFMYGGIIIYADGPVCGFFSRANHVTVELENGFKLSDTLGVLEGSGKNRRHIKLSVLEDVKGKRVEKYLKEAFKQAREG